LRIGTWNVLSRASNILKQEREKVQMDMVALQEIRWLGNGTLEKNCVNFYSCNPVKHVFGVGFYVNSRFLSNILHFEPANDRLCWNRVRGKFRNYSIINAHAPTEDKDDEEDKFYLELETVYSQCPRHDKKWYLEISTRKWIRRKETTPMQQEMDCTRNVMETAINWYSLPLQQT
jgi:exonuclease III